MLNCTLQESLLVSYRPLALELSSSRARRNPLVLCLAGIREIRGLPGYAKYSRLFWKTRSRCRRAAGQHRSEVTSSGSSIPPFGRSHTSSTGTGCRWAQIIYFFRMQIGSWRPLGVGLVVGKRLHRIRRRCGSLVLSESPGSHCQAIHGPVGRLVESYRPKMLEAAAYAV